MSGSNSMASGVLRSIVERIERLNEEKKALTEDIAEIFKEAKSGGFDVKALRALIRERRQTDAEREEHEAMVETYRSALGALAETPLGAAAIQRVA